MNTTHHLNEQMLLAHSAGVLPEAFDLVIACHLYLSEQSRALQCCYDALGGVVLDNCEAARMSSTALSATLHQIKTGPCDCHTPKVCTGTFPEPLQAYIGDNPDNIRWRRLGKGCRQAKIATSPEASARLVYIPPGLPLPDFAQQGTELLLVLKGSYRHGETRFRRGDIEITPPYHTEPTRSCAKKGCILLYATDHPPQRGWLKRLLPPL
jgi:putative transcriptional regulator